MSSARPRAKERGHRGCAAKRGHLGRSWEPRHRHPTPTPVPRLPWGAAMRLRTSGRKLPRGFAAQRFARLGLLVVAKAGTASQKLLNNHTAFTSHSEGCITILPITGQTDYFAPNRGRQLDTITNHNSPGLVKGQANVPPIIHHCTNQDARFKNWLPKPGTSLPFHHLSNLYSQYPVATCRRFSRGSQALCWLRMESHVCTRGVYLSHYLMIVIALNSLLPL